MHPQWIGDKTINNVVSSIPINQEAWIKTAKDAYTAKYKKPANFTVSFGSPIKFVYIVGGADGAALYHRNDNGEHVPVTPVPIHSDE